MIQYSLRTRARAGSFFFILLAAKHYLSRFSIMYSKQGIVVGAGYTDVIAYLPIIKLLMILAIISAVAFYVWIFYISKQKKLIPQIEKETKVLAIHKGKKHAVR